MTTPLPSRANLTAMLMASLLSACGSLQGLQKTRSATEQMQARAVQQLEKLVEGTLRATADHDVATPLVLGQSVALAREVTLPDSLRQGVKLDLYFKGAAEVDLPGAAIVLSRALGVPVYVRPDALLPMANFAWRTTGSTAGPVAAASKGLTLNLQVGEIAGADLLDLICHQSANHWRFENGAVEIYRLVTRVLELRVQAAKYSVSTGLGRTGTQGGSFESSSQTKVEHSGQDSVSELRAQVEAMLTRAGTAVLGSGSLVVTDTADSVARIAEFVERENRALSRRVKLVFEAIEVASRDNSELGLNWDALYTRLAQGALPGPHNSTLSLQSPRTLASANGSVATAHYLDDSRFSGSSAVLNALAELGQVVNHTRVPMQTQNRRPVQYAVRTNFDYVSAIQVSTVASSAGTTTAPAITQKEETVGTVLTVTPHAYEGGQILLNLAYDNTILRSLDPYSVGTGANALSTVQQKTVDGSGTVQSVSMRSGQTLLISGIEKVVDQFDQRRLDKQAPILTGGSDRTRRSRSTTVLLVTAVSEEGN